MPCGSGQRRTLTSITYFLKPTPYSCADGQADAALVRGIGRSGSSRRQAASSGRRQAASSGRRQAASSGRRQAASSGRMQAASSGRRQAASSGSRQAASNGCMMVEGGGREKGGCRRAARCQMFLCGFYVLCGSSGDCTTCKHLRYTESKGHPSCA
eukprot:362178-Chlamydomonas_euryale.AAC.6